MQAGFGRVAPCWRHWRAGFELGTQAMDSSLGGTGSQGGVQARGVTGRHALACSSAWHTGPGFMHSMLAAPAPSWDNQNVSGQLTLG